MTTTRAGLGLALTIGLAACGDAAGPTPADATDAVPDAADASDAATADADLDGDAVMPDADDATDAADGDASGPQACAPGEACAAALTATGLCPDRCFPVPDRLACAGVVVADVCHVLPPETAPTAEVVLGDLRVTPIAWGDGAVVGQPMAFELRVTNESDRALDVPFAWRDPGLFTFEGATWRDVTGLQLPAHGTATLTATMTATRVTVFEREPAVVATFTFGDDTFEPRATVRFSDSEPVACGASHFPETYCPDPATCAASHDLYGSARCCDGVFFPGAACCSSDDCVGARCVDGKCVGEAPSLLAANTAPTGNVRLALVLVDEHPELAADPCADHADTLAGDLGLDAVGRWYDDLARRRLGRATMALRWTVRTGVATSDLFEPADARRDLDHFAHALGAFYAAHGCPLVGAFDKVVIAAPSLDLLGFGGLYADHGLIGVTGIGTPHILTHELGHSFGATDLYLDLGGALLHPKDLMGDNLGGLGEPEDGVLWGELGFGDLDRDGVVDVVRQAAFPDTLEVADLAAVITAKGSLEITWRFVGREVADVRDVVVADLHVAVPAASYEADLWQPGRVKRLAFDGTQVDLDAVRAAGSVAIAIDAALTFTDRDWQPVTRSVTLATDVSLSNASR